MSEKARVYIFGFTSDEKDAIDTKFGQLKIPPAVRIRKSQGHVVLGDIIDRDAESPETLDSDERVVLFHNVSVQGVVALMRLIREIEVPKPIFATVTEHSIKWPFAKLLDHLVQEKRAADTGAGP